jgi:PKD repeat protein
MKGRIWLTVFLLVFVCLASTAFAEQVVEVWRYPLAGLEDIAASARDGSVWVIEANRGRVARLGADLQELVQVQGFAGASAIAANSADGSCWVGDFVFEQVVHLAADGTELSRSGGIPRPEGLSVDPVDGSCWVVDGDDCEVVHLAANGTELSRTYYSGLTGAIAAVPGTNSCWFAECYSGDEVHHLQDNLDGSTTILSSADDFSDIRSISVDTGDGTVWVSDCTEGGAVYHLQEESDYSLTTKSTTPLDAPQSVSAVPGAGAWVVEHCGGGISGDQPYVLHLDADGNVDITVTDLRYPFLVSADGSNQSCWVLGWGEIAHLAAAGDELQREPTFVDPRSVAADPNDGSSWVADCYGGRVVHVTADGDLISSTSEVWAPALVAVNPTDGSVWVVDWCENEVIHLAADGSELFRSSDLCCPVALAVDPNDGSCWVADNGWYEENCGIVRLSADDGSIAFGQCLPYPSALAVDAADSTVWVGLNPEYYYYAPAADIEDSDWIVHFAEVPEEEPALISATPVPAPANCLAVDPNDSSCLATLGEGPPTEPDALSGHGAAGPAPLDDGGFTVPVLRITETPSGPTMTALGTFWMPMGVSVNPADRSIWVADGFAVGHMAADGTVLSRTTGYCCVASLSVDTGDGSCWIAAPRSADVADLAVAVEAEFTASADTGVAPFEVSFTDLSTGSPYSWAWTFGDGGTSTDQNPTHTYGLGHYTVSLTVEGVGGSDTETKVNYIYAGAIAPTANFSATPTVGQAPLTVTFEDLSTNSPTEWLWSFGDGASSDAQNPTHEYEDQGVYTVSLVVSNSQGYDVETKTDYITVQQPLTAAFSTDVTRGASPLGVQFTDESVGGATSWLWSFGDGDTATGQNPIHYYEDPGFYTVTLLVSNGSVTASVTKSACLAVGFTDTPGDHWALLQEIACAEAGIVQGYWDGSYDPYGLVTRAQMATFIARALAGGDENVPSGPATPTFADVDPDNWAYRYIEYCADQEIVVGYWNDMYRPEDTVDRGQMAVFIARMVAVPTGMEDYTPPTTPTFSDVTSTNEWAWCYKYVEYVAALDPPVVVGYPDGSYRPQLTVTRDQMAVYMQRAFDLPIPSSTP